MNFSQILSILRVRWWLAALVLLVTVGATVAISLLLPKQYAASASVVLDVKPDPIAGVMYAGMLTPSFMATQVDVIQSDRVATRVVRNLKLADNPQIRAQWQQEMKGQGTVEQWLMESFQKNMDVRPSRESNVITIAYKAPDPRFAAGMANAFVQAYIDTALELRVDPARQYSNFFDGRAKAARESLERAQNNLSAFQKDKGIIASDERLDVENARLNELSSQLVMIQAITADSGSRQTQATGKSADQMQEVLSNSLVAQLRSDLSRQEARLQELNAKFGDAHPQVVELKANIAELRQKVDQETRRVTGGVSVTNTINRSREAQLRNELESQRTKVLRMKGVRDEGSVLVRDVENAQRAYDAVMARFTQSSLESQSTQGNAFMLSEASPPTKHASPNLALNTLLAVFVGGLLAIVAALGTEMMDRRVRGIDDIAAAIGLPVIGVMPGRKVGGLASLASSAKLEQRVIGRLPGPKGA